MDYTTIAKSVAIPSAFLLGSYNFVFSQNVVPHLYTAPPSISTPIFAKIFNIGGSTIAPVAASTILAYSYLSYNSTSTKRNLYATSAALTLSTLVLTLTYMKPGINRLIEISKDTQLLNKAGINQEVNSLFKAWVSANYFRASLHLTAGVLGFYALLS
ncbi:hypothetical protein AMS68_005167 [Peltaster fructicola]|uniref:DUF1772-domain-containing protein n=1 Tax=Peltaster fructicola TaxID=286661 RepID=A0A6H0XZ05_9PEZI|nr:hypothetical protein AMS68_005167 [Peltaster fructicola]